MSAALDPRSEKEIAKLHPVAQSYCRAHVSMCNEKVRKIDPNYQVKVVSGYRTYAEQTALYAKGRTAAGPVVTNARAGQSNHNFAIAWDIGIFYKSDYLEESYLYEDLGVTQKAIKHLDWGGAWKGKLHDTPHYGVISGLSLAQLRQYMPNYASIPLPAFQDLPAPSPTPGAGAYNKVKILDAIDGSAEDTGLFGLNIDGAVLVPVRKFVDRFGGTITGVTFPTPQQSKVLIAMNHHETALECKLLDESVSYARVRTMVEACGWDVTYDKATNTITVM